MRYSDISNTDDIIDSRDVEKRIEELESLRDDWQTDNELPDYIPTETTTNDSIYAWTGLQFEKWAEWEDSDDGQELKNLESLRDDLEGYCPDWRHGVTLIRESYFVEYSKNYIIEIYGLNTIPDILKDNINWDGVAEDLQQDFTSGEFDDVTYWAR